MFLAWAAGLGLLTWQTARVYRKPPVPGRLLGASVVFAALAMLAAYPPATRAATLAAWGFDVAVLFKLPPNWLTWQNEPGLSGRPGLVPGGRGMPGGGESGV